MGVGVWSFTNCGGEKIRTSFYSVKRDPVEVSRNVLVTKHVENVILRTEREGNAMFLDVFESVGSTLTP